MHAEQIDIIPDPFQGQLRIQHAGNAGSAEPFTGDLRQMKVSEDIQPVVNGDHHHIASFG